MFADLNNQVFCDEILQCSFDGFLDDPALPVLKGVEGPAHKSGKFSACPRKTGSDEREDMGVKGRRIGNLRVDIFSRNSM